MTYEEARQFIEASNQYGSKLGLETVTELLRRIGNPQDQLKIIHIAGTNGKGSTAAYIAAILAAEGYRVGRYTSPSVFTYREKVQISEKCGEKIINRYITKDGIRKAVTVIQPACDAMTGEGFDHPTTFEIETAMAFGYLVQEKVDFAVIEVGLGGRLDATNAIKSPVCCVITSVSMDHMQYLGNTLSQIAGEKAGIIKQGVPVVTGNTNTEVLQVIKEVCVKKNASLILADRKEVTDIVSSAEGTSFTYMGQDYGIKLLGEHQISNAILAVRAVQELRKSGYHLSNSAIREGLLQTVWRGRFEILAREPYFIIDGAHNEDAALRLRDAIRYYFKDRRILFIMGVFADKDYRRILQIMAPLAQTIFTLTPDNSRALASGQLAVEAKNYGNGNVIDAGTVNQAIRLAYETAGKEDVIIAFGSLSFLGQIVSYLEGSKIFTSAGPSASIT